MNDLPDIAPFKARYDELDTLMSASDFYADQRRATAISREYQKLATLIEKVEKFSKLRGEIDDATQMLADGNTDCELRVLANEEIAEKMTAIDSIRHEIMLLMLPPNKSDSRNTVFEIRAGTGGEEAALFAGDLFRMYSKFAESRGWTIELMSSSTSETGGFKEVIFLISGEDVYKFLKFESGVHRVQRVPITEASGRIHTSAATVAVLPEAEEVDIQIAPEDLEISVCRASGPGGQGVNTTDSAVQILHKPSGMQVYCADERSQQKNKIKALKVLRSRLLQKKEEEERAKYAANRKDQIGSGDRSERIRTYNFPQNRLTDHRIGLTLHNLPQIMEGEIGMLIDALQRANYESEIAELLNPRST
ncbi:MAG: peptide chain release factor 1 [Puniceicoccales bacterium]|jgi:peptide chain release factor 1|nr:peptide chain release factor 1 [Puniceicoccales bacterium]